MDKSKVKIVQPVTRGVAKVPVVMQLEALECGAASLTMVMAYYKKWIPLEQVRSDCGVSRDGSSAKNILKAARSYGMQAKGYRYDPEGLRKDGTFPCIIHWNFNHFVVLCGFRGKYAYINDPARGSVRVTMEEFDRSFTGVCIMMKPTEHFIPGGKKKSISEFAKKRLKGAGTAVIFLVLTLVIGYLFQMISPVFSRFFMDGLLTGENRELLMPFIMLFAGVGILHILVDAITSVYSMKINGKMAIVGSSSYMWKVLKLPMEFFSQRMAGDIQMRRSSNETIAGILINTLAPLVLNAFFMIFYLVVMLRYSPILTLVGMAAIAINAVVGGLISKKRVNITRIQMRDAGKLSATSVSGIQMIETIKSSGAENGFFQKWAGYQASVGVSQEKFSKLNVYLGMIPAFLTNIANYSVLILGVWLAMQGEFTIGMIMTFQSFLTQFMEPANTMISAGQTIQEMRTQMERVEDPSTFGVYRFKDDGSFDVEPDPENETGLPEDLGGFLRDRFDRIRLLSDGRDSYTDNYQEVIMLLAEYLKGDYSTRPGQLISGIARSPDIKLTAAMVSLWYLVDRFMGVHEIERSDVLKKYREEIEDQIKLTEYCLDNFRDQIPMTEEEIEDLRECMSFLQEKLPMLEMEATIPEKSETSLTALLAGEITRAGAEAGYSDEEIQRFVGENNKNIIPMVRVLTAVMFSSDNEGFDFVKKTAKAPYVDFNWHCEPFNILATIVGNARHFTGTAHKNEIILSWLRVNDPYYTDTDHFGAYRTLTIDKPESDTRIRVDYAGNKISMDITGEGFVRTDEKTDTNVYTNLIDGKITITVPFGTEYKVTLVAGKDCRVNSVVSEYRINGENVTSVTVGTSGKAFNDIFLAGGKELVYTLSDRGEGDIVKTAAYDVAYEEQRAASEKDESSGSQKQNKDNSEATGETKQKEKETIQGAVEKNAPPPKLLQMSVR